MRSQAMCQLTDILHECLSEVRAMDAVPVISDEEFVGPLLGKGLRAKRSRSKPRKVERFNIDVPLWYKDVEENNASRFFSNINLMEPKAMSNTKETNATNAKTETPVNEAPTTAKPEVTLETLKAQMDSMEANFRNANKNLERDIGIVNDNVVNTKESTLKRLDENDGALRSVKRGGLFAVGMIVVTALIGGAATAYRNSKVEEVEVQ